MKLNRQAGESFVLSTSGAKGPDKRSALIAALQRCATKKHFFTEHSLLKHSFLLSRPADGQS